MRESTAEILRQLELELIRLDDFRWRLSQLGPDELWEIAARLTNTAEALSAKAQALAKLGLRMPPVALRGSRRASARS